MTGRPPPHVTLEEQTAAHAEALFPLLVHPEVAAFTNAPADLDAFRARLARLETRASPDGRERWLNLSRLQLSS